jgi:hypothetical protein
MLGGPDSGRVRGELCSAIPGNDAALRAAVEPGKGKQRGGKSPSGVGGRVAEFRYPKRQNMSVNIEIMGALSLRFVTKS